MLLGEKLSYITIVHIVGGCRKVAQTEYGRRHPKVAQRVQLRTVQKVWECTDKRCDNQPLPVTENGKVRITWGTIMGLSAGTGKHCVFGHLGLVFIWN